MIDSCSAKCVAANGYHEEDLNKGETVCINRCVKKFLEVHKFVQEKMQDNQVGSKMHAGPPTLNAGGRGGGREKESRCKRWVALVQGHQ